MIKDINELFLKKWETMDIIKDWQKFVLVIWGGIVWLDAGFKILGPIIDYQLLFQGTIFTKLLFLIFLSFCAICAFVWFPTYLWTAICYLWKNK